ncbi:MAG: beta-1,4-galactosyltransferase [Candidatus Hydrogenedentes bacterium]|nr:beta-1,4-galactosyltransferase [Candidatus Hydrogenedentota bacterium]
MIYVTLGTMFLDFTRLVEKMDQIAAATGEEVMMQIGLSRKTPRHCRSFDFKPREAVLEIQRNARVIVAHGGIGAALDALEVRRPLVMVPRLKRFGEHMNDHQIEVAEAMERRGWGRMILNIDELDEACASPPSVPGTYEPAKAPLIAAVRAMVTRVAVRKAAGAKVRP